MARRMLASMTVQPTEILQEGIDWSKVEWPEGTGRRVSLEYETEEYRRLYGDD